MSSNLCISVVCRMTGDTCQMQNANSVLLFTIYIYLPLLECIRFLRSQADMHVLLYLLSKLDCSKPNNPKLTSSDQNL